MDLAKSLPSVALRLACIAGLALSGLLAASAAEYLNTRDSSSGALSWKVNDRGFSLELIQLPPDFIRAFYASRDLPPPLRDEVADFCTFGTVARNESNAPVSYRVADWRAVTADGVRHKLRTKSEWLALWKALGPDSRYSVLPDVMTFDVGDWFQGLTAIKLPRGTKFDLVYTWRQHGKTFTGKLPGPVCPSETNPAVQP